MKEKQYVQHISGQGEKWEVRQEMEHAYVSVRGANPLTRTVWLPKSEYHPCDPPERWVDVTEDCEVFSGTEISHRGHHIAHVDTYRLRKAHVFNGDGATHSMWAFIVEKDEQP